MISRPDIPCWKACVLAALGAALSVSAFPPCRFEILAWASLVPYLYALVRAKKRDVFFAHGAFCLIYFGLGLFWMSRVHFACPILVVLPLYFLCLPFPLLYRWAVLRGLPIPVAAPVVWCANDYFRSFIITGFPWLFPGHTQAFHPVMIQIADITGVHGVTFAIVLVNAVLLEWVLWWQLGRARDGRRRLLAWSAGAAALCLLIAGYGVYRLQTIRHEFGPRILGIQGNIPQSIKNQSQNDPALNWRRISDVYDQLTVEALREHPDADILIWPETMIVVDPLTSPSILEKMQNLARVTGRHILFGAHRYELAPDNQDVWVYNSAFLMTPDGMIVLCYDKVHLVILGEYLPLQKALPFLPAIVRQIAGFLPGLTQGEKRPVFSAGGWEFGTLICYDIVYAEDARDLRRKGCRFLVNITNEGWFSFTAELEQIQANAIFRSVENRIGVVRVGNTGITCRIPPTGEIALEDALTVSPEDYLESLRKYTPFVAEEIAGQSAFAWHHFPESLWRGDTPVFARLERDWDIELDARRVKWKDFPGVFCTQVPLATEGMTVYTRVGDLFAQSLLALVLAGSIALLRRKPQP